MENQRIDLTVIIVSFNTAHLLRSCLQSVYEQTPTLSFEILISDNASTDESITMLEADFPEVKVTVNETNVGFAQANNRLIPHAKGRNLVLLNPDTVIRDQALERMVRYLDLHHEVGAIAPRLVLPNGDYQGGDAGFDPSPKSLFVFAFMLHSFFPGLRGLWLTKQDYQVHELQVDWLSGACLMIRNEVVKTVGTLSDAYFMYAEDIEWCYRIRQAGWKILLLNSVQIVHHHGAATKQTKGNFGTLGIQGLAVYYKSRYPRHKVVLMHLWSAIGFMLRAAALNITALVKRDQTYRRRASNMFSASVESWIQLTSLLGLWPRH